VKVIGKGIRKNERREWDKRTVTGRERDAEGLR
jgi:hypothetical protein